jgi:5'-phosphate synthase pdxT subunit
MSRRIAVLALQGAFAEHCAMLERLGAEPFLVRKLGDFAGPISGLVLPGGESTVMNKLLRELGLFDPIMEQIRTGLPVFGTCAGLLLLAREVENQGRVCFGTMDIAARRNAYGRQLGSFAARGDFGGEGEIPMVFIRAPYIVHTGEGARVLAKYGGKIVAAQQANMLVTAFHPELTDDLTVHRRFLGMCNGS